MIDEINSSLFSIFSIVLSLIAAEHADETKNPIQNKNGNRDILTNYFFDLTSKMKKRSLLHSNFFEGKAIMIGKIKLLQYYIVLQYTVWNILSSEIE